MFFIRWRGGNGMNGRFIGWRWRALRQASAPPLQRKATFQRRVLIGIVADGKKRALSGVKLILASS